jgi:2-isopropylmalate synthase
VLIESGDARGMWGTVGVSENIIEASWEALNDAVNYKLMQSGQLTPSSLSDLAAGVAS